MGVGRQQQPSPVLYDLSVRTVVKLCTLAVCFRGDLYFLNCDYICMCVVNKQFEFLEFVCNSLYVALKYNQIYLTFTVGYVCLCGVCSHCVALGLSVTLCGGCGGCGGCDTCTGVCVGCEYAERVRGCERYGNACVVDGGGAVAMSVGHEYVGDVRGPGIVSSAADLLG